MRDGAVAEILGAHVAGSEPSAALWQRVAQGELSADDAEAELLAGRPNVSEHERAELERAKRVFAPPSAEQRRERLAALLQRRAEEAASGRSTADGEAKASSRGEAGVVSLSSHRSRRWAVALLAVAAAAVLLVWLVPPRTELGSDAVFVARYALELDKAVPAERGEAPATTFQLDWKIVIRLRPDVAVHEPVGAVMYVTDDRGRARRLEVEPTANAKGVMELDTTVQALGLEDGEYELVVAVGRPDALPSSWEALVDAERVGPVGFEVVRRSIRVKPPRAEGTLPSQNGG